jgi:hypothetical protein
MKVKLSFYSPSNGHTAVLVIEVISDKLPMFIPGDTWFNVLLIDSYEIIEEESTSDYKDIFVIESLINKNQIVVSPLNRSSLFFMNCPEVIEK